MALHLVGGAEGLPGPGTNIRLLIKSNLQKREKESFPPNLARYVTTTIRVTGLPVSCCAFTIAYLRELDCAA